MSSPIAGSSFALQVDVTGAGPGTVVPDVDENVLSTLFGPAVGVIRRYAEHLATTAVERGLLGPREVPRIWDRHILNCAVVQEMIPPASHVVDVGSGAGLPGLVLAIARPDLRVQLVEPLQRRVDWLDEVLADLGTPGVTVVRGRAERLADVQADVCTARAVASLSTLTSWCLPLLRPRGLMLALKGQLAHEELAAVESSLHARGATSWSVEECGADVLPRPTTVVAIRRSSDSGGGVATLGAAATGAGRRVGRRRST